MHEHVYKPYLAKSHDIWDLKRIQECQEISQARQHHHQCIPTTVQPQFHKIVQVTKVKCGAKPKEWVAMG